MMPHHLIALAGFATREHAAIESVFSTAPLQPLNCTVTNQLGAAALVIADGDNGAVIRLLRARPAGQKVLLIGRSDGANGWPTLPRRFRMADFIAALSNALAPPPAAPETPVAAEAPPKARAKNPSVAAFAATEPFAPLADDTQKASRKSVKRAFAATEPFAPLSSSPAGKNRTAFAATEPFAPLASSPAGNTRTAFAATEPFAPLSGGTAGSFAATEPFAPLTSGSPAAPARRRATDSRAAAADDVITSESMAAFKREQGARTRAVNGQTDFMGIAAQSGFGADPRAAALQVLVVDDSEIGLRLLQRHLLELGAGVTFARGSQEALKTVAMQRFSHVFVDSMMSGMAGLKTCRAIKNLPLPEGAMPKVVLITNLGGSSDRSKGMLAGCEAYLFKPFKLDDLRAAMAADS